MEYTKDAFLKNLEAFNEILKDDIYYSEHKKDFTKAGNVKDLRRTAFGLRSFLMVYGVASNNKRISYLANEMFVRGLYRELGFVGRNLKSFEKLSGSKLDKLILFIKKNYMCLEDLEVDIPYIKMCMNTKTHMI